MTRRAGTSRQRVATLAIAGLAMLASGPDSTGAQELEPMRLTLEEALGYAAGSNPALRRATNSAQLNGVESRTTWFDQLLPQANLTLFRTGFEGNLRRVALDDFGNPVARPDAEWNYFSQTTHSLGLNWSFQGPSLFRTHQRQQLTNQDRDLAQAVALTGVQVEVQRRYADALEQRDLLEMEQELIEARRIDLDVAERLFGLALRTRVEVLNAELAVEQQTLAAQRQETTYQQALLSLKTAMGLSDDRPVEVVDIDLPLFDPERLDADGLISRALDVNPSIRQADVATRLAEVGLSQEKNAWWPQIDMGMIAYRQAYGDYGEAIFDASLTSGIESNFYIQFSLPILNDFFALDMSRQRASVELSNQRELDREARLELEESIRGALLDLENQWASLQLSERSTEIAAEALRLAREEYRLGTRSFEDLRLNFEQEAQTRRDMIMARHQFVDALLVLEEAVGAPVRELAALGSANQEN